MSYSVYHKVLSVGDYSEDHMFDAIEAVLTASSMTKKKVRERVTVYCVISNFSLHVLWVSFLEFYSQ